MNPGVHSNSIFESPEPSWVNESNSESNIVADQPISELMDKNALSGDAFEDSIKEFKVYCR